MAKRGATKISDHPTLSVEFDTELNFPLSKEEVSLGADKKVWWRCSVNNHSWLAKVYSRKKSGCPICSGRLALRGFNDLVTTHPHIASEFDRDKNLPVVPEEIVAGTSRKLWWLCTQHQHSWLASGSHRLAGSGCPVCANREVVSGFNDLVSTHPELAKSFDGLKNSPLTPSGVASGSEMKVWWLCPKSHSWRASLVSRVKGSGCPICYGRGTLAGFNDLYTKNPYLSSEFDAKRNFPLTPNYLSAGSNQRVWWKCSAKGHSWKASVNSRHSGGVGCPVCSGKSILLGFNDLASLEPDLSLEFDRVKNFPITPEGLTVSSAFRAWWKCSAKGHSWQAYVYSRTYGSGCPKCIPESQPESTLRELLGGTKKRVPVVGIRHSTKEVDVWLESLNAVVEYDGWYWHKDKKEKDLQLSEALTYAGYKVVRVRESPLDFIDDLHGMRQLKFNSRSEDFESLSRDVLYLISEMETPNAN